MVFQPSLRFQLTFGYNIDRFNIVTYEHFLKIIIHASLVIKKCYIYLVLIMHIDIELRTEESCRAIMYFNNRFANNETFQSFP